MNIAEIKGMNDIATILKEEQERNEQFRTEVIELLKRLAPQPTQSDPYKSWADDIGNVIQLIIDNTEYTGNKAVLSEAYRRMNKKYGIVFEQERHEYIEQNGETPRNNMELTYYIEQKNSANRGLLKSILVNMAHEEQKPKQTNKLTNYPVASIEDLDNVIMQIGGEEHAPSYVSEYRSYVAYYKKHVNVDWGKYAVRYCIDEQSYMNPKNVRTMRVIRKYSELQPDAIKQFNAWVKDKYADRI